MRSGKLDDELQRMSEIAETIRPYGILLCNESFASTNEAEGSEIARQVVRALLEADVRVAYVTHMYELAHGFHAEELERALFLRAERLPDGKRTFRMVPGEPEPTSYGIDSYRRIFGKPPRDARTAAEHSPS
jgi:DNA mismatch repair ATPase MutS